MEMAGGIVKPDRDLEMIDFPIHWGLNQTLVIPTDIQHLATTCA
jgi:hypothetical protein